MNWKLIRSNLKLSEAFFGLNFEKQFSSEEGHEEKERK